MKWSMVMKADGSVGDHIHLPNQASKGKSGRIIALNKELKKQLIKVKEVEGIDRADFETVRHSDAAAARNHGTGYRQLLR